MISILIKRSNYYHLQNRIIYKKKIKQKQSIIIMTEYCLFRRPNNNFHVNNTIILSII